MESNKPDFEELAQSITGFAYGVENKIIKCGMEKIWTDYVTPLQSQLSEAEKRIKELQEEIETLNKFDER